MSNPRTAEVEDMDEINMNHTSFCPIALNIHRRFNSLAAAILIFLTLGGGLLAEENKETGEDLLAEGVALVEDNLFDNMGATREGLEEGIEKILKAIEFGISDPAQGYWALARAYDDLAYVHSRQDPDALDGYTESELSALEKVIELRPHDTEALYLLATRTKSKTKALRILERILEVEPNHRYAGFDYATALIDDGRLDKGFDRLNEYLSRELEEFQMPFYEVRSSFSLAERIMKEHGRDSDAEKARKRLEELEYEHEIAMLPQNLAFADAKRSLEKYCPDCEYAKATLARAIRSFEQALEHGHPEKAKAYKGLAEACGLMARHHAEEGSPKQLRYLEEQKKYEALYRETRSETNPD